MTQEVLKHLKAITESFGPDAGIELDQKAWAKLHTAIKEALEQEQEPVAWGVDWGRAGDIPCVSIIKRLPNGGIEVVAVEYAPYTFKEKNFA